MWEKWKVKTSNQALMPTYNEPREKEKQCKKDSIGQATYVDETYFV